MCARELGDEDTEPLTQSLTEKARSSRRLHVLPPLFVMLAIAGTATWWTLTAKGQAGIEDGSDHVIGAWSLRGPAPLRAAADKVVKSVGVSALVSKEGALKREAQAEATAGQAVSQIANRDRAFAKTLQDQTTLRQELAGALTEKAMQMKAQAQGNISSATVMKHTAEMQVSTAKMIEKQAEDSIGNANHMKETSNGVDVVDQLVKKQLAVAQASKDQAATQRDAAHAMMSKSADLLAKAQLDKATAEVIDKEGSGEMDLAKAVTKQMELALSHAENATSTAMDMQEKAQVHQGEAKLMKAKVDATQTSYVEADSQINRATAEIKEAVSEAKAARKMLRKANEDNKTAFTEKAAAQNVLKTLEAQRKAIQEMKESAKGMKNAQAVMDVAAKEVQNVDIGLKKARAEIAGAEVLAQKAAEAKAQADKAKAEANAMQKSAQKREDAAAAVKAKIDSNATVSQIGSEEDAAMKGAAKQDTAAAQALQEAVQKMEAATAAQQKQVVAEVEGAAAMKDGVPNVTAAGGAALEEVQQRVESAAEALKKAVDNVKAADPGPMEVEAGQAMTAAIAREKELSKNP
jgi:hypothetical protein